MTKSRMAVLGAVAAFALLLVGGAGPAAAQGTPKLTKKVKMTGETASGRTFRGTYTIKRFTSRGSRAYAVGTLKGRLKGRTVTRRNLKVPATLTSQSPAATTSQVTPPAITPTPGACTILSLHLGAIDLNLLGLRVRTNDIDALIEGVPGPGNLLGNLLCAVTGLLDPQPATPATPASQLARILNAILALLG